MGIKDKIFGKMLNKILGGVDVNNIQKNVQEGKYDVNKMIGMVEKMIGKNASDNLIQQIQEKVKKGEKINFNSILNMMKNVDLSKVAKNSEEGNLDVNDMKEVLNEIVGEEKGKELLKKTEEAVNEIVEEEE